MIRLLDAADAVVHDIKIRDYLLNAGHPQNGGKAAFFTAFGFDPGQWTALRDALAEHAAVNGIAETSRSPHGTKHVVRCSIKTPDGRNPSIATVWIVDGGAPPRLVTSYP